MANVGTKSNFWDFKSNAIAYHIWKFENIFFSLDLLHSKKSIRKINFDAEIASKRQEIAFKTVSNFFVWNQSEIKTKRFFSFSPSSSWN